MTYQLWDPVSSTLLAETADLKEIAVVVRAYIDDVGPDILDELSLSIDRGDASVSCSGDDVLKVVQGSLAQEWAPVH